MPGEWETYYLMIGSSAAALIGLLFVVMTLSAEIDAARADAAQRIFQTPVIVNFGVVFVISAAALAPERPWVMALAVAVPALVGLGFELSAFGRMVSGRRVQHWSDYLYYGALPALIHLFLLVAAAGIWMRSGLGVDAVALGALALLLLAIRNAWDLATWLTYHRRG